MPPSELTLIVRRGFERLCSDFTDRVARLGFSRGRKVFWSRPRSLTADVLHFHRMGISYGAPSSATVDVRIHLAIRVLNDDAASVALNGPSSRDYLAHRPGYHLSFNARSFSQFDRCLLDAVRFLGEQAESWFATFSTPEALLGRADSPLAVNASRGREVVASERVGLEAAIRSGGSAERIAVSRKLLGLPAPLR